MKDTNKVTIIGRLTANAELKEFNGGFGVIQFTLAVNTTTKKDDKFVDQSNFFSVKHRGKNLANLTSMLVKGKQICIEGYLSQDRWEKDGKKNSIVVINSENIQLLGGKSENNNSTPEQQSFDDGYGPSEDIPF